MKIILVCKSQHSYDVLMSPCRFVFRRFSLICTKFNYFKRVLFFCLNYLLVNMPIRSKYNDQRNLEYKYEY